MSLLSVFLEAYPNLKICKACVCPLVNALMAAIKGPDFLPQSRLVHVRLHLECI